MMKKEPKSPKFSAVKRKLSPLDELARKAPGRGELTKREHAEVLKLLGKYKVVDDKLDAVNSRQFAILAERERLAHQIVARWGKGLLIYRNVHYMPASNHGKIVLRRLPAIEELA